MNIIRHFLLDLQHLSASGQDRRLPASATAGRDRLQSFEHRALSPACSVQRCHRHKRLKVAAQATATVPQSQLSQSLRNNLVTLEADGPSGKCSVYLLGVSHVSQVSCEHIRDLIRHVKPEAVMVELCKDRTALLVDPDTAAPNRWHARLVRFNGLPEGEDRGLWPSSEELQSLLITQPHCPLGTAELEAACITLLSTGLFRSVRPMLQRPNNDAHPQFLTDLDGSLGLIAPVGGVEFTLVERTLPKIISFEVRVDSSLKDQWQVPEEKLDDLRKDIVSEAQLPPKAQQPAEADEVAAQPDAETQAGEKKAGNKATNELGGLISYLRARQALLRLCEEQGLPAGGQEVVFRGAETGQVEVIVKARTDDRYRSGLERSAVGGAGFGIERFRPVRQEITVGFKMRVELDKALGRTATQLVNREGVEAAHGPEPVPWRPWNEQEFATWDSVETHKPLPKGPKGWLVRFLTRTYSMKQADAGEEVDVSQGEAWRVAMEEGAKAGARQVILGDIPAALTTTRLADKLWDALLPRSLSALGLGLAVAVAAQAHVLPDAAGASWQWAAAGVLGSLATVAASVGLPLWEVSRFSNLDADEIEEKVAVQQPLQDSSEGIVKLWGEDALLDWPGALEPIIEERDMFMANVLRACASGAGAAPAYILDKVGQRQVWRLVTPPGAPAGSCPVGEGDGQQEGHLPLKSIVAVVGTAHVKGMMRSWSAGAADTGSEAVKRVDQVLS
ncbi:hypothetical protein WJX74_002300 [Apatococcus lobatus]|uniref:TraB n=1 Tax=Apatococcus lobatus TaxID=904363 RepID=A0AAW1QXB0_9CHLO